MDTHGSAGDKANIDSLTGNKDAFIRNSTFAGYSTAFDLANIALLAYPFGLGGKVAESAAGELLLVNEVKAASNKFGNLSPGVLAEGDFGYLNQAVKQMPENLDGATLSLVKEGTPSSTILPITDPARLLSNPAKGDPNYLPPWSAEHPILSYPAPEGMRVSMAINERQIDPLTGQINLDRIGGFTTKNSIQSVEQVHMDLAVKTPDWGPPKTHVQEFEIKAGTQVQDSTVGPQIGSDGKYYVGGGNQVEPLVPAAERKNVLIPIGPAKPLSNGISSNAGSTIEKETAVKVSEGKTSLGHPVKPNIAPVESNLMLNERAAMDVSKVTVPIDFEGHILSGEIKKNGSVVGGHSTASGRVRVIPGTKSEPNAQGVYIAAIEVPDPKNVGQFIAKSNNGGMSTMFPDSWTADRIKVEVDEAFKNKQINGNKWTGKTPSGVIVEGWLMPKTTVYPKY